MLGGFGLVVKMKIFHNSDKQSFGIVLNVYHLKNENVTVSGDYILYLERRLITLRDCCLVLGLNIVNMGNVGN